MRSALLTLPWVEPDSVVTNLNLRQVRFQSKAKDQFDLPAVQDVLAKKGYPNAITLAGPTEK